MRYATKECLKDIHSDFLCRGTKGFANRLVVLLFRQDFHLLLLYRIGRWFDSRNMGRLAKVFVFYQLRLYSCQLSPKARIASKVKFPHPIGIVIGEGCRIGPRVRVFQQVTIGGKRAADIIDGPISYPTIESGATLFPQSMAIGGIRIGKNAVIGAQSLVLSDIPANSIAKGSPAKVEPRPTVEAD